MTSSPAATRQIEYDDGVVRAFLIASVVFGLVAMLVGAWIATQLVFFQGTDEFLLQAPILEHIGARIHPA